MNKIIICSVLASKIKIFFKRKFKTIPYNVFRDYIQIKYSILKENSLRKYHQDTNRILNMIIIMNSNIKEDFHLMKKINILLLLIQITQNKKNIMKIINLSISFKIKSISKLLLIKDIKKHSSNHPYVLTHKIAINHY